MKLAIKAFGTGDCRNGHQQIPVHLDGIFERDAQTRTLTPVTTADYADGRTCYFCGGIADNVVVTDVVSVTEVLI